MLFTFELYHRKDHDPIVKKLLDDGHAYSYEQLVVIRDDSGIVVGQVTCSAGYCCGFNLIHNLGKIRERSQEHQLLFWKAVKKYFALAGEGRVKGLNFPVGQLFYLDNDYSGVEFKKNAGFVEVYRYTSASEPHHATVMYRIDL